MEEHRTVVGAALTSGCTEREFWKDRILDDVPRSTTALKNEDLIN